MDENEPYDSLEEGSFCSVTETIKDFSLEDYEANVKDDKMNSRIQIPKKSKTDTNISRSSEKIPENLKAHTYDDLTTVPLYSGEIPKETVKYIKKTASKELLTKFASLQPSTTSIVKGRSNKIQKKNKDVLNELPIIKKRQKSYLAIFHNKIGYPGENVIKEGKDTTRALCGDNTGRSVESSVIESVDEYQDAQEIDTDSERDFYLKHIEKEVSSPLISDRKTKMLLSVTSASLSSSIETPLRSISEQILKSTPKTRRINKVKKHPPPVPTLGKLGPDTEAIKDKLELLRKKNNYGQKMSDKNRIRLMEKKLLKNLKSEMESANSNIAICDNQ